MELNQQHLVFFSATANTRAVVREVGNQTGFSTLQEHNITRDSQHGEVKLSASDLLIIGVPSYQGRVPSIAIPAINRFKGQNTPAIIVCTYGNRDYEDTLLELKDLIAANGFKVVAAGAFVARHSIFSKVAADRPNAADREELALFTKKAMQIVHKNTDIHSLGEIALRGNYPYRLTKNIPLRPTGDKKCDSCGTCVQLCPTEAIPADHPRQTDKAKCISCARCIAVCPQKSRAFGGLLYKFASNQFVKKNSKKQPNCFSYTQVVER